MFIVFNIPVPIIEILAGKFIFSSNPWAYKRLTRLQVIKLSLQIKFVFLRGIKSFGAAKFWIS